jgi:dTDP-L-rhamnose 4-epimerase
MAQALAASLKGHSPVVTGRYRLGDIRHITADSSRLRAEPNWQPTVLVDDGMAELAHA